MRVGLIGAGAIATYLLEEFDQKNDKEIRISSVFVRNREKYAHLEESCNVSLFTDLDKFLQSEIDIVVEAANVAAVREVLPTVLQEKDTVLISIGSLVDEAFMTKIKKTAEKFGKDLYLPSGAIGGLDLVQNMAAAGVLEEVSLVTKKPAHTLVNESIHEAKVIFEGKASDAIKHYPKNMNVSIALALAGVGFKQTKVTLIADPALKENIHSILVRGYSGTATFTMTNNPLPSNPNTSYLAAVSIVGTLRRITQRIKVGG